MFNVTPRYKIHEHFVKGHFKFYEFSSRTQGVYCGWAIGNNAVSKSENAAVNTDYDDADDDESEVQALLSGYETDRSRAVYGFSEDIDFIQKGLGGVEGMYIKMNGMNVTLTFPKSERNMDTHAFIERKDITLEKITAKTKSLLQDANYRPLKITINEDAEKYSVNFGYLKRVHKSTLLKYYSVKYDDTCTGKKHEKKLLTETSIGSVLPEYVLIMTGDTQHMHALKHKALSSAYVPVFLKDLNRLRCDIWKKAKDACDRLENMPKPPEPDNVLAFDTATQNLVEHLKYTTRQQTSFVSSQYSFICNGYQLTSDNSLAWTNIKTGRVGNIHSFDDATYIREIDDWDKCVQDAPPHEESIFLIIRNKAAGENNDTFDNNIHTEELQPKHLSLLAEYVDNERLVTFDKKPPGGAEGEVFDPSREYDMLRVVDVKWVTEGETQEAFNAINPAEANNKKILRAFEKMLKPKQQTGAQRTDWGRVARLLVVDWGRVLRLLIVQKANDQIKRTILYMKQHIVYKIRWSGYDRDCDSWISSASAPHRFARGKAAFSATDIFEKFWNNKLNLSVLQGELFYLKWFSKIDINGTGDALAKERILKALKNIGNYQNQLDYLDLSLLTLSRANQPIKNIEALFSERKRKEKWAYSGDIFTHLGIHVHNTLEYIEAMTNLETPDNLHSPEYDNVDRLSPADYKDKLTAKGTARSLNAIDDAKDRDVNNQEDKLLPVANMRCTNEIETAQAMVYNMKASIKAFLKKNPETYGDTYRVIATEYTAYYPLSLFKSTRPRDLKLPMNRLAKRYHFMSATPDAVLLTSKGKIIVVEYKDVMENTHSRAEWLDIPPQSSETTKRRCVKRILDANYTKQAFYEAFVFHAWTGIRPDYVMTVHTTRASPTDEKKSVLIVAVRCVKYDFKPTRFWNRCRFLTNVMTGPLGQGTTDTAYMDDLYYVPSMGALLESHISFKLKAPNLCAMLFGIQNVKHCKGLQPTSYLIKWIPKLALFNILLTMQDRVDNDTISNEEDVMFYHFSDDTSMFENKYSKYNDTVKELHTALNWTSCGWLDFLLNKSKYDATKLCLKFANLFDIENDKDVCKNSLYPHIMIIQPSRPDCKWADYVVPILGQSHLEKVKGHITRMGANKITINEFLWTYLNSKEGELQRTFNLPQRNSLRTTAPPLQLPTSASMYCIYGGTTGAGKHLQLNDAIKRGAGEIQSFILKWLQHYTLASANDHYAAHVWQALCLFREIQIHDGKYVPEYIFPREGGHEEKQRSGTRLVYKGEHKYYKRTTFTDETKRKDTFFQMIVRTLQRIINSRVEKAFVPTAYITSTLTVGDSSEEDEDTDEEDNQYSPHDWASYSETQRTKLFDAADSVRQVRSLGFRQHVPAKADDWYGDMENDDANFTLQTFTEFTSNDSSTRIQMKNASLDEAANLKQSTYTQKHKAVKCFLHESKRSAWSEEALDLAMSVRPETGQTPIQEAISDLRSHLEIALPMCIQLSGHAPYVSTNYDFNYRSQTNLYKAVNVRKSLAADFIKFESKFMK